MVFSAVRGSGVLAALVLCASMSAVDSFAASPLLTPRPQGALRSLRPPVVAARVRELRRGPAAVHLVLCVLQCVCVCVCVYLCKRVPACMRI